jgi:hypothetical protein
MLKCKALLAYCQSRIVVVVSTVNALNPNKKTNLRKTGVQLGQTIKHRKGREAVEKNFSKTEV